MEEWAGYNLLVPCTLCLCRVTKFNGYYEPETLERESGEKEKLGAI